MESADRATGDCDKGEGKNFAGEHRTAAVDEAGEGRHVQRRMENYNTNGQQRDRAELNESAEIVARGKQQPHGQGRCGESVNDNQNRQGRSAQAEDASDAGGLRCPLSAKDCEQHEDEAKNGYFHDFSRANPAKIDAHQKSNGDSHGDGESSPRTRLQRIDDNQSADAEQDNQDRDHGDISDESAYAPGLFLRHLGERLAIAANREDQDDEVLHAAGKYRARQNPQSAGQIAELNRQHGPDQRPRACDGSEVMSEHYPLVGDQKITAILEALRWSGAPAIKGKNFDRDKAAVKEVSQRVAASRCRNQPQCINGFAAPQSDHGNSHRAEGGDGQPE